MSEKLGEVQNCKKFNQVFIFIKIKILPLITLFVYSNL